MPINRNALIRYKTIDYCLRNRRRKWTLETLMKAVSDALYEYEGIDKGISRRTIQSDIQLMRSDKLGYNAPIIVLDKKYYTYEDSSYSITKIPLSDLDLSRMNEAVEMLRQFKGFSHFSQLHDVIQKLEDHVYAASHQTKPVIDFEKNDQLKGLEYIEPMYHAIINGKVIEISYQSFTARDASTFIFHAWWLKEFKNRWYCVGVKQENKTIFHVALDRIRSIKFTENIKYQENLEVSMEDYYQHVLGVTVSSNQRNQNVILYIDPATSPYVETKPIHRSQEILARLETGILIKLKLQINFELEKELLSFGNGIIVISPARLRERMLDKMTSATRNYNNPKISALWESFNKRNISGN